MKVVYSARWLFVLLLGAVTFLTVTPAPEQAKVGFDLSDWIARILFGDAKFGDKVAHVAAYAALGATAAAGEIRIAGRAIGTLVALAAYGALLEGVQGLGGVRSADVADGLANLVGAVSGFGLAAALRGALRQRAAA
jgi:hypothetical protein